jgi:2-amino-4-hydroxy-6-hydroxymethyldihydropteridine diphosphokinase
VLRGHCSRSPQQSRELAGILGGFRVQDSDGGSRHPATLAHRTEVDVDSVRTYIGLGANIGDPRATLTDAVAGLGTIAGAAVRGVSSLYSTTPVGVAHQPDFLNAVVALDVLAGDSPEEGATRLLVALKDLERDAGRERRRRWGPRELDLDLLLFGQERMAVERPAVGRPLSSLLDPATAGRLLVVPHPEMRERLFVLQPLADLAPDLVPPGWDEPVEAARRRRAAVEGAGAVRLIGMWSPDDAAWIGPTGGPIRIDRATIDDVSEIARVHTAAAQAAYRGYGPTEADPVGRRTGVWQEVLSNPEHRAFVARDAGRMVGVLSIGQFRETGGLGAVHVLYVLAPWWGSGAGQQLLNLAHVELAKDYDEAQLTVLTGNARARRFYERNGWIEAETLIEPHFGNIPTEVSRYRRTLR